MEPRRTTNRQTNSFNHEPLDQALNSRSQRPAPRNLDERPVKINPAGKYNLDFIDWNNEFEAICGGIEPMNGDNRDQPFPGYIIPEGVSVETFGRELSAMQATADGEVFDPLPEDLMAKVKKMMMGKSSKECSVCFAGFKQGEIIRKLPCNHIFHDNCLTPWLKKNITCPNCRFNLVKYFEQNPNGDY